LVGLTSEVTFKVNCCKARHTITYTSRGDLILHDHDEADLDQLRMLRGLGAGVSRCLQVKEQLEEAVKKLPRGSFDEAFDGCQDSWESLPKAIFHYRRSRARYIHSFRMRYMSIQNRTRRSINPWLWNTDSRLSKMYQDTWEGVFATVEASVLPHIEERGLYAFPFVYREGLTGGKPWEMGKYPWLKRVEQRGLTSAVYSPKFATFDNGDHVPCMVVDSDPNWMLGDKVLRVMFMHAHGDREQIQWRGINKLHWGTARLEDKWYVTPDDLPSIAWRHPYNEEGGAA